MHIFGESIAETLRYAEGILPALMNGFWVTLKLFVLTLALSVPLGLPLALGSIC